MKLLRRHKYILTALLTYWPALFIVTHIPVPEIARKSGMSDKAMHFLAYLVLVCLVWLAISPYKRVNWMKVKCWVVLAVIVWYGAIDEWLQARVGRNADVHDFYADLLGGICGLLLLSVFSFWPALLVASASVIFGMTNFSRATLIGGSFFVNSAFYFVSYMFFALVWVQYMDRNEFVRKYFKRSLGWFAIASGLPLLLLGVVKVCSFIMSRPVYLVDTLTSVAAIACAVGVSYFVTRMLWVEEDQEAIDQSDLNGA
jgi:VanZ family protein